MGDPTVTIKQGTLKGKVAKDFQGGSYYSFQGIPYAKAPVGELRFKAPQPPDPWPGIFDATKEGSECPSAHLMFLNYVGKEDNCLNLCVYTKELPSEKTTLKPVMVWIHGGAFIHGSNKTEFFGPEYLMTEDVVQVFINYRLGILGFLSFEDESLGVPGNAALKDMVMALKWVRDNIEKFNGNPGNVTIYGESAGSASVHYLTLSPMAKGLFHKAIMQSGSALNCWAQGKKNGKEFAKFLHIEETDEATILKKMRELPAQKLVNGQMKISDVMQAGTIRLCAPVLEKGTHEPAFITKTPLEIMKSGEYNKVSMIFGVTSNEGLLYEVVKKTRTVKKTNDYEAEIPHDLNLKAKSEESKLVANKIKKFYGLEEHNPQRDVNIIDLKTDHHFYHGVYRSVRLMMQTNQEPIYFYRFSVEDEFNFFKKFATSKAIVIYFACQYFIKVAGDKTSFKNFLTKMGNSVGFKRVAGACHADDLGYMFTTFYSPKVVKGSNVETHIRRLVKLWTNFAKYGNPTYDGDFLKVDWPPLENSAYQLLDIASELNLIDDPYEDRIKFWDDIYSNYCIVNG